MQACFGSVYCISCLSIFVKAVSIYFFSRQNAAAAAAAAASQINQKLGSMGGGPVPAGMNMGGPGPNPHMGMGPVVNEEFQVPDRMVGLSKFFIE